MEREPLTEIDRRKSDLLAQVSHELKTPLTSIRNFADLMRRYDDLDGDTRTRYLSNIIDEVDRLQRLIHDLLDLSKIEAGRSEWRMADVDLVAVVRATLDRLGAIAEEADVRLELVAPGHVPAVLADSDRIVQVLTNLIGNAVKFTEAGGTVTVAVGPEDGGVRVSVADTGIGIPATQLKAIFDKFVQVKRAAGDAVGTGLGLPIAREIVEAHLGRISVESEPGRGTTFSFVLPASEGKSPFESYLQWRIGYARGKGESFTILLFDVEGVRDASRWGGALRHELAEALRASDAVVAHDRSPAVAAFVSVELDQQQPLVERLEETLARKLRGGLQAVAEGASDLAVRCVAARFPDQAESPAGLRALIESRR